MSALAGHTVAQRVVFTGQECYLIVSIPYLCLLFYFHKLRLSVSRESFSLHHHSLLIWLDCFSVVIHCTSYKASMKA